MRFLPPAVALLCLAAHAFAAPGGYLVEAISDECDTVNPIWGPGLRGMPEALSAQDGLLSVRSVDNGDDAYPSAEDMVSDYAAKLGRPLEAAEGPSVVAWVWLPPFAEWPTGANFSGFREWLGVRVTAYDADLPVNFGLYWPGIYVATDDIGPCLIARVGDGYAPDITLGHLGVSGWWTLGLAWNAQGRTEYYAAAGRVALTSSNLVLTTPTYPAAEANRSLDQLQGNFLALRMTFPSTGQLSTNWLIDAFRVYVKTPPALPRLTASMANGQFQLEIDGWTRGFRYLVQKSDDLGTWNLVEDLISDGEARTLQEPAVGRSFYRVRRP